MHINYSVELGDLLKRSLFLRKEMNSVSYPTESKVKERICTSIAINSCTIKFVRFAEFNGNPVQFWKNSPKFFPCCSCLYIYRPQRSCGQGYVFTRVCDSVHRGGGLRAAPPAQGGTSPGPGRENPPRTWQTPPHREEDCSIRSMSGRYASYWNAFLLPFNFETD